MLLLALAVAPGLAICFYIFAKDVYNREPSINLIMSFVWGMVAVLPAAFIEFTTINDSNQSITSIIFSTFLLIALVEELSKFLVLRYYAFTRSSFDEPLDGIVYSIMVSMGFATVENIGYVWQNGLSVAFVRMFTTVPAHATFAVVMGYYAGKAKFDRQNRNRLLLAGVFWATLLHGTYDAFLFLSQNARTERYASEVLLFFGAFVSLMVAVSLSRKLITLHQLTSQQLFKTAPVLTIRTATADDIVLIRDLCLQVWPQTYAPILTKEQIDYMLNLMYSEASLHQQLNDHHRFLIVYNAGVPVGFASYSEVEPAVYKLHKIYILPIHQGRGAGRYVIEQICREIASEGATALQLNVNRNNMAKSFYERLGFEVIREEDIDIGNGFFMNDYIMEKKLIAPGNLLLA